MMIGSCAHHIHSPFTTHVNRTAQARPQYVTSGMKAAVIALSILIAVPTFGIGGLVFFYAASAMIKQMDCCLTYERPTVLMPRRGKPVVVIDNTPSPTVVLTGRQRVRMPTGPAIQRMEGRAPKRNVVNQTTVRDTQARAQRRVASNASAHPRNRLSSIETVNSERRRSARITRAQNVINRRLG